MCRFRAWQADHHPLRAPLPDQGRPCLPPFLRRGGRVVECAALEMRFTGNRNVGSNPTLSATIQLKIIDKPFCGARNGAVLRRFRASDRSAETADIGNFSLSSPRVSFHPKRIGNVTVKKTGRFPCISSSQSAEALRPDRAKQRATKRALRSPPVSTSASPE